MKKTNVLVLSAGRRVELVESFKNQLRTLLPDSKVFATDIKPALSAACHVSDEGITAPRVTAPEYPQFLYDLCVRMGIGLLVPTIDTELSLLAEYRKRFAEKGIYISVSDIDLVKACRDKRITSSLFSDLNIAYPKILDRNDLTFPCFCKPYDGSCSAGAMRLDAATSLTSEMLADEKNMFMELVPSTYCEYTIDAYYDRSSILKCLVPRKRIEVRGGEISKGVTRKNFVYDYLFEKLRYLGGARGCITLQFFVNEETRDIKGLEINPRFGGGFPLSDAAGANFPLWLIKEYFCNDEIAPFDGWEDNLLMLRYDAKVLTHDYH